MAADDASRVLNSRVDDDAVIDLNRSPEARERAQRSFDAFRAAGSSRIRLLLADDHAVLRQSLRLLLEMQDEIEVVGEVDNGRAAVEAAGELNAEVVLMDMRMPGLNGVEATRQIRKSFPQVRILMLAGGDDEEQVLDALRAGASGYVVKQSDIRELLVAIQAVHRGNPYLSSSLAGNRTPAEFLMAARDTRETPADPLTGREREVLQLVVEGHSNQTIASMLFLSVKTVEAHKAHIMAKLRVQSQTDLIRYALRRGIISLESEDRGGSELRPD
jgi:DNA-binding NarL/FixJ family response regulator